MTDTTDAIVDAMARAICIAKGGEPDALYYHHPWENWPTDQRTDVTDTFTGELRVTLFHYAWRHSEKQARAALAAALPMLREVAAKCADKRTEDRFADFGVTEPDTNSSFYPGRCADIYYQLDEEDECVAGDIRARFDAMTKETNR